MERLISGRLFSQGNSERGGSLEPKNEQGAEAHWKEMNERHLIQKLGEDCTIPRAMFMFMFKHQTRTEMAYCIGCRDMALNVSGLLCIQDLGH